MTKLVKITGTKFADLLNGSGLGDKIKGKQGADILNGAGGNDKIKGGDGNDLIAGGGGDDNIDGGKGIDTAVYQGLYSQYSIVFSRNGDLHGTVRDLVASRDGTDSLKKVEFLQFQDAIYDVQNDVVYLLNAPPAVANAIADQSVAEDTAVLFTVPANTFADGNGDALTYSAALEGGGALPAWLAFNPATRTFSGTPPLDFNGFLDVRVSASDGSASASDVFRLTITPVNDAPVAADDSASGDEDTPIVTGSVLANDSDVDDTLTPASIAGFSQGAHGGVVYNGDGTFTYTPHLNFNGGDSFTYTITDGDLTSQATVHVSVDPANDAPTVSVVPVTRTVSELAPIQTITAAFLLAASGAADVDGDPLTIVNPQLFGPDGVEVPLNALPPGVTVTFNPDGSFASLSFDPADFSSLPANASATVKLEFDVSDGRGGLAHDAALITITGVNSPAVIGEATFTNVTEDVGVVGGDLLAVGMIPINDADEGQAAFMPLVVSAPDNLGTLSLAPNGAYTYRVSNAAVQFLGVGAPRNELFTVHSIDGTQRGVVFAVQGTNDPVIIESPLANGSFEAVGEFVPFGGVISPISPSTVIEDWVVIGSGIDYVREGYQGSTPAHGGAFIDLSGSHFGINGYAGGIAQTFNTIPGFRYLVEFFMSGNPDGGAVETLRVTASGDTQDFSFDTAGRSWTDLGWTDRQFTFSAGSTSATLSFQSLTPDFMGPLIDHVRVTPINALTETVATIDANLVPDWVLENNVAFSDRDYADTHTVGTFYLGDPLSQLGAFNAVLQNDTVNGTGGIVHWTYQLDPNRVEFLAGGEHHVERYTIRIDDLHLGPVDQNVLFDVTGTNDLPVIAGAPLILGAPTFDVPLTPPLGVPGVPFVLANVFSFSDVDLSDSHDAIAVFNSLFSGVGPAIAPLGTLQTFIDADTANGVGGVLRWRYEIDPAIANALPAGISRTDAFDVVLSDNHGGTSTGRVVITITGTGAGGGGGEGNVAPLALPDTYFVAEAGTVQTVLSVMTGGVLANDLDSDPLTAELLSGPSHALFFSFDPDGTFTYLPQPFFVSYTTPGQQLVQSDSFEYRAFDGTAHSAPTTVTINVTPPPHVHGNTFTYDMQGPVDAAVQPMAAFYDDLALGNPVVTPGIAGSPMPTSPQTGFTVTTATEIYLVRGEGFTYGPGNEPTGGFFNSLELLSATPGFPKIALFNASTGVEPPWSVSVTEFWQALQAYAGPASDPAGLDTIFQAVRYDIIDSAPPVGSVIVGGPFGDELRGAAGADTLYGGLGDDVISGGASSFDVVTGGPGADRFEFGSGDGVNEIVTDFSGVVGGDHDVLDLRVFVGPGPSDVAHTFEQVMAHTHQDGGDTVIDYAGTLGIPEETVIRLQNFDIDDLRPEDILYAPAATSPNAPHAADDFLHAQEDVPTTLNVLFNDSDPQGDPLSIAGVSGVLGQPALLTAQSVQGATITVNTLTNTVQYDPTTLPDIPPALSLLDQFAYTITDGNGNFASATVFMTVMGAPTLIP